MSFLSKISSVFGDPNTKELKKIQPWIVKINEWEKQFKQLSDEQIKEKTSEFKQRIKQGESLNKLLPEAFAVCREAGKRTIGQRAYDTQLLGGIALHQGKIAEMKTGEGKTLAATFAVYLNALEGKGVHIITVNDYLARRDTNWMGTVYSFLGLSVGCVQHDTAYFYDQEVASDTDEASIEYENLRPVTRQEAYRADITYGTNNEFGFDYLRDNMAPSLEQTVQIRDLKALAKEEKKKQGQENKDQDQTKMFRKDYLNFAVVDEVDNILIDESRTPLIISAPDAESTKLYLKFAKVVPKLILDKDYNIDEKMQAVTLTDKGISKVEKILGIDNLYLSGQMRYVHHLHQALKAHAIFKKDKQYVVRDGEVMIVDDFTGRLMPGRRFSEGLHQALEAKEGVKVQRESRTLATITFQNYFRLYKKLSGMTGTALTSAEEFSKVYKLDVLSIPTHQKMIRINYPDKIYKNEAGKFNAIVADIKARHQQKQPVLVGTISVDKSETLSKYLDREGVEYEILNAKNHEREAQIITRAGRSGVVTIATNMAGRGTDIKLGKGVVKAGGLHIIGTERHEARRIDNQLRGRSGRQGDPGSSQFYVSLEDELMERFGSEKIKKIMDTLGLPEDQPIENKLISRSIESAQKKIEGFNFDIRKHVLEYDDVINHQRETIYQKRRRNLLGLVEKNELLNTMEKVVGDFVSFHTRAEDAKNWNLQEIFEYCQSLFTAGKTLKEKLEKIVKDQQIDIKEKQEQLKKEIINYALKVYQAKEAVIGSDALRKLERAVMLRTSDTLWMEHLDNMQYLREGVGLRGYGQRDPLVEYKKEGFDMFQNFLGNIRLNTVETLFKIQIASKSQEGNEGVQDKAESKPVLGKESKMPTNLQLKGADANRSGFFKNNEVKESAGSSAEAEETTAIPIREAEKIGRNDPCPCGSGKKYKKCCGKKV
ncbi:MAG: SEC-C metal-binding domain-containing protein [Patescibacteria group bacterium]|nr:SEC-C metal-binding domain-containing protein [Patescibacteria group bacterium]